MTAKETLAKVFEHANQQCKMHNVNVDFFKSFCLHDCGSKGGWQFAVQTNMIEHCSKDAFDTTPIQIGTTRVPWHKEANENYIYFIHPFYPEVKLEDNAYTAILEYMLSGCYVTLKAANINDLTTEFDNQHREWARRAKDFFDKRSSMTPVSFAKGKQDLQAEFKDISRQFNTKTSPTITLVPKDVLNIEQLNIWLDLNEIS